MAFDLSSTAPRARGRLIALLGVQLALSMACGDAADDANASDVAPQTATRQPVDSSRMDAGLAVSPRTDAGLLDGATADDGALFCAVKKLTDGWCTSCHDDEGTLGAPMSLLTYEDFLADAPISKGKKTFEAVGARMNDTRRPMPPIGRLDPPDLKIVNDWIAAGAPPPPKAGCVR